MNTKTALGILFILLISFSLLLLGQKHYSKIVQDYASSSSSETKLEQEWENARLLNDSLSESGEFGEMLFKANCTVCHRFNSRPVGLRLNNLCQEYGPEDRDWLAAWIRNSPKMIFVDRDKRAIDLWEKYDKQAMNAYPTFTDEDIDNLLEYLAPECFGKAGK